MTTSRPTELGPDSNCGLCLDYITRHAAVLTPEIVRHAHRRGVTAAQVLDEYLTDVHAIHCWCGMVHPEGFWHDPTHGQVDRDIQDRVRDGFQCTDRNQEFAIMLTAQGMRDRGWTV